jgi:hypothetical protein
MVNSEYRPTRGGSGTRSGCRHCTDTVCKDYHVLHRYIVLRADETDETIEVLDEIVIMFSITAFPW